MERRRHDILMFLGFVMMAGAIVFATHMSEASGQASQGSPAFREEQAQTRAMERSARALDNIHAVLRRIDRRCR